MRAVLLTRTIIVWRFSRIPFACLAGRPVLRRQVPCHHQDRQWAVRHDQRDQADRRPRRAPWRAPGRPDGGADEEPPQALQGLLQRARRHVGEGQVRARIERDVAGALFGVAKLGVWPPW